MIVPAVENCAPPFQDTSIGEEASSADTRATEEASGNVGGEYIVGKDQKKSRWKRIFSILFVCTGIIGGVIGMPVTSQARATDEQRTKNYSFFVEGTEFSVDAPGGQEGRRDRVARAIRADWPDIHDELVQKAIEPMQIHLEKRVEDYFERTGTGYHSRHWVGGLAIPSKRVILIEVSDSGWRQTLVHELIHLAEHALAGGVPIPRWYNEGVAINLSGASGLEETKQLLKGVGTRSLLPFDKLDRGVPSGSTSARIAYAQSYRAVADIGREFGQNTHHQILSRMGEGYSFQAAFRDITERGFADWEEEWMAQWQSPFAFLTGISSDMIWAIAAVFGAFALVFTRLRHNRKRKNMPDAPYPVQKPAPRYPGEEAQQPTTNTDTYTGDNQQTTEYRDTPEQHHKTPDALHALGVRIPRVTHAGENRLKHRVDKEGDQNTGKEIIDISGVGSRRPGEDGRDASSHHHHSESRVKRETKDSQDQNGAERTTED